MKTTITMLLLSVSIGSVAQIKIWPGGAASYGNLSTPPSGVKHYISGNTTFDGWTDVKLDWSSGYCCGTPALYPENDWYFQLGTSSKFLGDAFISHVTTHMSISITSDKSVKENVNYTLNTLPKLLQLKPATYNFNANFMKNAPEEVRKKVMSVKEYGFIAQELKEVFPELVDVDPASGMHSVKYLELIPMLVDAIQQQNKKIEELSEELSGCCSKSSLSGTPETGALPTSTSSFILQNKPNPFNSQTVIDYKIANKDAQSQILLFDLNGKLIKTYKLSSAESSLTIRANELNAGMYYYSLVIDNKEIDTKKMIITE